MLIATRDIYKSFLLKDKISYEEFDKAVKKVLKSVRDRIINGEKVRTPLGTFSVKEKERHFHRPSVNLPESLKERERLISEGEIPYVPIRDKNGKIIGDNGGKKYFRYFKEDTFFTIYFGNEGYIKIDSNTYKFIPAHSTQRMKRKRLREDKLIRLKYAQS